MYPTTLCLAEAHRDLVNDVKSWCNEALPGEDSKPSIDTCRRFVRLIGQAGWFKSVLSSPTARDDIRRACLIRLCLAARNGLGDFAFGHQLEALAAIRRFGSDEQQRVWIPRLFSGEFVASLAWSEPATPQEVACTAVREGAHWLLDGEKTWVAMGEFADVLVVFARMKDHDTDGISAFVVPGDAPGVVVVERLDAVEAQPVCRIRFEGVQVPMPSILVGPGQGQMIATTTYQRYGMAMGAASIGLAGHALRLINGAPVDVWSSTPPLVEETHWALTALELLMYRTAERQDADEMSDSDEASRVYRYVLRETQKHMELMLLSDLVTGREGLLASSPVERIARQIRALRYGGMATRPPSA